MPDHDKSLWDRAKDALGMGGEHEHERERERDQLDEHEPDEQEHDEHHGHGHGHGHGHDDDAHHQHGEFQPDDHEARRDDGEVGVDGATQASASSGMAGGMGASGAMGGAGSAGPVGVTPDPSDDVMGPASGDQVRTEYEMGHEFDPEHEKVAESGLFAERAGEAEVDTWRTPADEDGDEHSDEDESGGAT